MSLQNYLTTTTCLELSSVRNKGDILKYAEATLISDTKWVEQELSGIDPFKYVLAMSLVSCLSLFKITVFTCKHLMKPMAKYDKLAYNVHSVVNSTETSADESLMSIKEGIEDLNKDNYITNSYIKSERASSLNSLRVYLYQNSLQLKGKVLKRVEHRVSENDLIKSVENINFMPKLSTTQVTFGNDLNNLLSNVLPNMITLKKRTSSTDTYLTFKDDDYGFLEESLKQLYNEPIRVIFE